MKTIQVYDEGRRISTRTHGRHLSGAEPWAVEGEGSPKLLLELVEASLLRCGPLATARLLRAFWKLALSWRT